MPSRDDKPSSFPSKSKFSSPLPDLALANATFRENVETIINTLNEASVAEVILLEELRSEVVLRLRELKPNIMYTDLPRRSGSTLSSEATAGVATTAATVTTFTPTATAAPASAKQGGSDSTATPTPSAASRPFTRSSSTMDGQNNEEAREAAAAGSTNTPPTSPIPERFKTKRGSGIFLSKLQLSQRGLSDASSEPKQAANAITRTADVAVAERKLTSTTDVAVAEREAPTPLRRDVSVRPSSCPGRSSGGGRHSGSMAMYAAQLAAEEEARERQRNQEGVCRAAMRGYCRVGEWLQENVISKPLFDWAGLSAIFAVAVVSWIDVWFNFPDQDTSAGHVIFIVSGCILAIFTVEFVLKMWSKGERPWMYFLDHEDGNYNTFDLGIIVASYAFITSPSKHIISVLRLFRLLRMMHHVRKLRVILRGLYAGLKSVMNIILVLMLLMYLTSIGCVTLFGRNDPGHFGGVIISMLTLMRMATFADWKEPYYINYFGCDKYDGGNYLRTNGTLGTLETEFGVFYPFECYAPEPKPVEASIVFVGFSIIAGFVIVSLFVGVITMGLFDELSADEENEREVVSAERQKVAMSTFFGGEEERVQLQQRLDRAFANEVERKQAAENDDSTPEQEGFWALKLQSRSIRERAPNLAIKIDLFKVRFVHGYLQMAALCKRVATSPIFNGLIIVLIVAACLIIGFQTNRINPVIGGRKGESGIRILDVIDNFALGSFTAEVFIKICAEGLEPSRFFEDRWNLFDVFVVGLSYAMLLVGVHDVAILRLFRLFRILKLIRGFQQLRVIVEVLIQMVSPVFHTLIIFGICNYIFAMFGLMLFRKNDPQHFGSIRLAMITVWLCETLDDWDEVRFLFVSHLVRHY